jgi:hypothetical protein
MGQDVDRVTEAAVKSAIKAAGPVGSKGARTVGDVLTGVVRGIDDVAGEATDKRSIVRKRKFAVATKAGAAVRKVARAPAKTSSKTAVKSAAKTAAKKTSFDNVRQRTDALARLAQSNEGMGTCSVQTRPA